MGLSSSEIEKANQIKKGMVQKNAHKLIQKYGFDAEKRITGRAINMAKKLAEQDMEQNKLREMVKAVLTQPVSEKKGRDMDGDGDVDSQDYLAARDVAIKKAMKKEDLDLGHEDNEPHMIKAELYRIGKYAMELYQMVDQFEGEVEVDFPAWWQAKITSAKDMVSSAKHYLEFELKEPEIDAMVGIAADEDIISSTPTEPLEDEIEEEISAEERLAAAIQKALNKNKSADDQNNIRQARKAMNDGNIEAAKKILQPYLEEGNLGHNELASLEPEGRFWIVTYRTMDGKKEKVFTDEDEARAFMNTTLEEGLPKGYWSKKIEGGVDESYEALVKKIKGQGKSEKAAKAIAGAVASYKAKGGGKGPTAKQKAK